MRDQLKQNIDRLRALFAVLALCCAATCDTALAGSDPGTGASVSLTPASQYVHPTNRQDRPINGTIDIGAYEFP